MRRYGVASFGNTVRFLKEINFLTNNGAFYANTISFNSPNTKISNSSNGIIKTNGSIGGTIRELENKGAIFSENSCFFNISENYQLYYIGCTWRN